MKFHVIFNRKHATRKMSNYVPVDTTLEKKWSLDTVLLCLILMVFVIQMVMVIVIGYLVDNFSSGIEANIHNMTVTFTKICDQLGYC